MKANDIFTTISKQDASNMKCEKLLTASRVPTQLGDMIAIADDCFLYYLGFVDSKNIEIKINKIKVDLDAALIVGSTKILTIVEEELCEYFKGNLTKFSIPLHFIGTDFQKQTWNKLVELEFGKMVSYGDLAVLLGKQTKHARAVGNAVGKNPIVIVVPCHRIIAHNNGLGGFGCGLERKTWLLDHESKYFTK